MSFISKIFGPIWEYVSVLFNKALKEEMALVLPIAARLVKQFAADPSFISGAAKREAAIAGIVAELAAAQTRVAMSVVSLAVELAYTKSKIDQK